MNLKELNSFKLSDAVTFHDKLNPKLWNSTKLLPEVKDQLIKIAEDFLSELGVHDLDVKDITISGSNAAYSYTKHSDLDLHILVDMGNLPVDEVYKELFNAKKTIYNDSHDIKIHTIPVELYVQDSRQPVVSLGEYSVMNDEWIKIPTKRRSDFDQTATKIKYEKLLSLIEIALKSRKYSKVKHIIDTIKRYRQAGLDKGGEFGPENLAYKMLRSQGYITKLYDLRDKLHSEILTVETMYQNIDEGFDQPYPIKWEKGDHGDIDALARLPDGTNLSIMFNKQDNIKPDDKTWMVEFHRNNSQEVTGEGDAQKVFATVLSAIQQFIVKYKPLKIYFSASKEPAPLKLSSPAGAKANPESRAKLYDRLVLRYAKSWGYKFFRADNGSDVMYQFSRIPKQNVDEAFNTPLPITWEKGEHGDVDALAKLPDGTNLSIMFNKTDSPDSLKPDDKTWMVEFYRNNSQEVTGEGDAQKVFSTVLIAIQQFITKYKPLKIYFSASKLLDPSINYGPDDVVPNPESRAKLYDRLIQRYVKAWGYRALRTDTTASVKYELSRIPMQKAVGEDYTMQFATEKTPVVSPYAGVKDNQYRGGISEDFSNDMSTEDMIAYLKQHHDKNLHSDYVNHLTNTNSKFVLKNIPLTSIRTELSGLDRAKVEQYKKMDFTKAPPIVVGSDGNILDGYHRATVAKALNIPSIKAYVGIKNQQMSEVSGYIPSEKQKNDPRFKTALTVDVRPDSIKKNAKAFYWNTSRAGIPPTAKANGKIS
jgi:hypothetical protein